MAKHTSILSSIARQIDRITGILYEIYEEETLSEQGLAVLKQVHKRLWHFIKSQEAKIQQRKKRQGRR